jgi:hypothetical protein
MNIKGKARGGPLNLAAHVQKAENESVRIVGIDGLMAQDIEGALMEMDALGTMLRTDKTLYHGIISPEPGKDFAMTEADWDFTRKAYLKGMGFEGQPFIEIEHEKFGKDGVLRLHRHIITALADAEVGYTRAIHTGHNFRKHEEIARHVERQLGHEHVQGAHIDRFGIERPERTPSIAEQRAAERGGVSAKEAKALGAELWNAADSGKALNATLEAHGWQLARGDKTRADGGAYFMAIDPQGEAHELRRMMPVKAAALYERMADIDPASLPSIKEAKAMQEARQIELEAARAEHQAREAAKGRVDDIRPETASRDFAATQTAPEAAQQRESPAAPSAVSTRTGEHPHHGAAAGSGRDIFSRGPTSARGSGSDPSRAPGGRARPCGGTRSRYRWRIGRWCREGPWCGARLRRLHRTAPAADQGSG